MKTSSDLSFATANAHNKVYGGFEGVEVPRDLERKIAERRAKNMDGLCT
jgi:hypothetical protein